MTYPNGLQSSFTYDDLNRVTAMNAAKASYSYTLSPTGNRTGAVESSGRTLNWSYDGIYRLTNETISLDPHSVNGSVGYGLDPVGNRQSQTSSIPGIATGSFTYDPDDRFNTETYDANGNTLTSGGKTFAYDFENRLKSMTAGSVTVTLAYDADGNRVAKTVNGVTTRYLVDDLNPTGYAQVVEEVTNGAVTRTYTYGLQRINGNQLVSNTWTPSFYGYDAAGTVRLLTDSNGTVTDTYDYDAWGNTVNTTGSTPNVFLYQGEQYDTDLALYYLRARYLDPVTGRFLETDPYAGDASDPATLHRYLYAAGDPVNRLDPTGRTLMERALESPETLILFAGAGLATIYGIEQNIKCVWCAGDSQLDVGLFVDLLPPGVHLVKEIAGRTLCTFQAVVAIAVTPPWYFRKPHSDPIPWPGIPSPGPDPNRPGKCLPCPPPSPYWVHQGNAHGCTGGFHLHWWEWNQKPYPNCECRPARIDGCSPPSGGTPHAPGGPQWP